MEDTKTQKNKENPVISPLANEKTYGERWHARIFGWGLNYWTNLLVSAGFSQYAEHGTKPIKLPFIDKEFKTPREYQQQLAGAVREKDWFFKKFVKDITKEMAGEPAAKLEEAIYNRSMARARSLVLLIPGFFVMIPSVLFGAKVKPWLVEKLNEWHYGKEAMDDPSLKARHQAIEAEARPTLDGATFARFGTVFFAQAAAQGFGSKNNRLNKLGKKYDNKTLENIAIDPITEGIGTKLGDAMPEGVKNAANRLVGRWGYDWSIDQRAGAPANQLAVNGTYTNALQDFGRFVVADTVYTAVTALTIKPLVKFLPKLPIIGRFMSVTPKMPANAATFDGEKIKVPANRYADEAPNAPAANEPVYGEALSTGGYSAHPANEPQAPAERPRSTLSHIAQHTTLVAEPQHKIA